MEERRTDKPACVSFTVSLSQKATTLCPPARTCPWRQAWVALAVVLAAMLMAPGGASAQARAGRDEESAVADRLRRALQTDLADTFPAARIKLRLQGKRVQLTIELDTPGLDEPAILEVLDTIRKLAASDLNIAAPGYTLTDDSTFSARGGAKPVSRRMGDYRVEGAGPEPVTKPLAEVVAPATPVAPRASGAARRETAAGLTILVVIPARASPEVVRLSAEAAKGLRTKRLRPAATELGARLGLPDDDATLLANVAELAENYTLEGGRVVYLEWQGETPRIPAAAVAVRVQEPDELLDSVELSKSSTPVARPAGPAVGPSPKVRPRKRAAGFRGNAKGSLEEAVEAEKAALSREKRDLRSLASGPATTPERPWEAMKLGSEPPPAPRRVAPPVVLADLIDLRTARIAPRQKVIAHGRTAFRDLDPGFATGIVKATERINEFDFRVGLTSRLEAQLRPTFTSIELTQPAGGLFPSGSNDQGSASAGLRYRLPYNEELFHMAVGVDAGLIKSAGRAYLLPEDQERLNCLYLAVSNPGGEESSWHTMFSWTPLEAPAGSQDNSLWRVGVGVDHRLRADLRALGELVWEKLEVPAVGAFGNFRDAGILAVNVGIRAAFRAGTLDLYARQLTGDRYGDYGLAFHASL